MTIPDTRLRTYLRAFSNDWLSRMFGPLSVPLGALAVFWKTAPVKELWAGLAVVAFFVASYRVWRNERSIRTAELENRERATNTEINILKGDKATLSESIHELRKQVDDGVVKPKQDLIRALTALRTMESKVTHWRDITNGKWGMSPPAETFVPDEMHQFLYLAEQVEPNLRVQLEKIVEKLLQAESCIQEFKGQPAAFQQERLMRQAYTQLDEAAPLLSRVISELAAFERRLGKP